MMEQTNQMPNPSVTCKNCIQPLRYEDKFCSNCAAQIVSDRINFKNLMYDLFNNTLGWDNKYFYTIKMLLTRPGLVLSEYLNGARKKYSAVFFLSPWNGHCDFSIQYIRRTIHSCKSRFSRITIRMDGRENRRSV